MALPISGTWLTSPGSGDYDDGTNWDGVVVPNGTGTAFFGTSSQTTITISSTIAVGSFTFNPGADDYDFSFQGPIFRFDSGIVINGGSADIANDGGGSLQFDGTFSGNCTAGSATLTNNNGDISFYTDSHASSATIINTTTNGVVFNNNSTADSADITNGGSLLFFDTSSADHATIISNNGALVRFSDNSTAGSASITNDAGGKLEFRQSSNAGNATIINDGELDFGPGGSSASDATITTNNGAVTHIFSTGGNAEFNTALGGTVDFSNLGAGPATAGSIAGAGDYYFGGRQISVGSNNLSTEVSGDLMNGGTGGGGPGALLVKVGSGTLTLSGSVGCDTAINAGTLQVDGFTAGAEITVNNGGTLSGNGDPDQVAVHAGGTLAPGVGLGAGILHTRDVTFASGAVFKVQIGGVTPGTGHDQITVHGDAALGGATLRASFIDGFDPSTTTATNFVIVSKGGGDPLVTGTFAGLPEGAEFTIGQRLFTISYHYLGNDVALTSEGARIIGTVAADIISATAAPAGRHTSTDLRDIVDGRGGNDRIYGHDGNDILMGGAHNDRLYGGADHDLVRGGRGRDILFGGDDRDLFDFNSIKESVTGSNRDQIRDFHHGTNVTGDDIDLKNIDAKTGVGGNQAFKFIGKQGFHDVKGELRYIDKGASCIVQGDVNGDGKADFEIFVKVGSLVKGDFLL